MEERILLAIHGLASPALDLLAVLSHHMATTRTCALLVGLLALASLARGERRVAAAWLLLGLAVLAVEVGVKPLIGRPRPQLWPRMVDVGWGPSFPSGHSSASAAFYPFLAFLLTRSRPRLRVPALALAAALSLGIGLGRLYLGVHWPTDVLAGWSLGAVLGMVAMRSVGTGAPTPDPAPAPGGTTA